MLEVGGRDLPVLSAVTNTLGNTPAALAPVVGMWLRRRTGSWLPCAAGAGPWGSTFTATPKELTIAAACEIRPPAIRSPRASLSLSPQPPRAPPAPRRFFAGHCALNLAAGLAFGRSGRRARAAAVATDRLAARSECSSRV
jgi:hypothetical protein